MSGDDARRLLRELLPEVLGELRLDGGSAGAVGPGNGHGPANGNGRAPARGDEHAPAPASVPQVPAPPTAAVLRPSTWDRAPAPGEVIGDSPPSAPLPAAPPRAAREQGVRPAAPAGPEPRDGAAVGVRVAEGVEVVALDTDDDLDRFVRQLLARFENPRDRMAIRAGKLRFALRRPAAAPASGATIRVERGAVTERKVKEAAGQGARLVLAPAAVLTPLAREQARALGVEIERERRC